MATDYDTPRKTDEELHEESLEELKAVPTKIQQEIESKYGSLFIPKSSLSQMKKADASGAAYAVIIGPDELAKNEAQLKDLRASGEQTAVALDGVVEAVINAILGATE